MGVVGKMKLKVNWKAFGPIEMEVAWRPSMLVASLHSERKLQQMPTEDQETIVHLPVGRRGQIPYYKRLSFFSALSVKVRLSLSNH